MIQIFKRTNEWAGGDERRVVLEGAVAHVFAQLQRVRHVATLQQHRQEPATRIHRHTGTGRGETQPIVSICAYIDIYFAIE